MNAARQGAIADTKAFKPIPNDDPSVVKMANFAASALSDLINCGKPLVLLKILSAEQQIVAGMNLRLQLKLGQDPCDANDETISCKVIVFYQPWTSTTKLTEYKCDPAPGAAAEV